MIWCVDDDNTILDIEIYALESTGFRAKGFCDGKSMLKALDNESPRLIVLDIMMPCVDGIEILRRLRANPKHKDIPVIMATAKGGEMDKIKSLDIGADDYLVKPFGVMEMIARIKAILRRCEKQEEINVVTIGNISLCESEHTVTVNGNAVSLTYKEFELLKLLITHPGIVFSRDKLMTKVWGVDYVGETRTVDMHIKTLRQKLGEEGKKIETVIGVGYRLEGVK